MLELTIKTLDSQNHYFTLPDEATVINLKESILAKMEVPIANQRLIFHGKVLQDQKKLTEYGDVNGKVIHLVQRAPPSSTRPSDGSSSRRSDTNSRPGGWRFLRREGNTTYLGSIGFPSFSGFGPEGMDTGSEIPPPPTQAMARNRLECARRMMGFARQSIRQMEDPSAQPQVPQASRPPRRQAVTMTTTATITVASPEETGTSMNAVPPSSETPLQNTQERTTQSAQAATAAAIAAAFTDALNSGMTIFRDFNLPDEQGASASNSSTTPEATFDNHHQDVAVEVEIESSDGNNEGRNDAEPNIEIGGEIRTEDGAPVDAMVPLLTDLETLHADLRPFLSQCRDLLSSETSFDDNSTPSYRDAVRIFGGVTETLHSIAHACHALSDLMVDFYEDAPRSLRCRPIVLQHSAILETGFTMPPHHDFHISLRRGENGGSPTARELSPSQAAPTTTSTGPTTSTASAPPVSTSASAPVSGHNSANPQMDHHVDFSRMRPVPHISAADIEVFMDFGLGPEPVAMVPMPVPFPPSSEASTTSSSTETSSSIPSTTSTGPTMISFPPAPGAVNITTIPGVAVGGAFVPNAGNMNYVQSSLQALMGRIRNELSGSVAPEELAAGQAAAAAASALGRTVSAAIGSMQSEAPRQGSSQESSNVGRETGAAVAPAASAATQTTSSSTTSTGTSTSTEQAGAGHQGTPRRRTGAGVLPPFPVYDFVPNLLHGGFDAALPCNSHHIRTTRQRGSQAQRMRIEMFSPTAGPSPPQGFLRGARGSARGLVAVAVPPPPPPSQPTQRSDASRLASRNVLLEFLGPFSAQVGMPGGPGGENEANPSAADVFNSLVGTEYAEGQSIVCDLLMTVARNITWEDLMEVMITRSSMTATVLDRLRPVLQEFATQRLLQGEAPTEESIKRACDRLFSEMRPYIDAMQLTRLRESVDLTATINNYNLAQLPGMIALIVEPGGATNFGTSLLRRITLYARQLVAIIMHCCVDGHQGFDSIVRNCVRLLTRGVPEALQQWTEFQSVHSLHYYTSGLNVPLEDIQGYLVYRIPSATPAPTASAPLEPMETDGVWTASVAPETAVREEEPAAAALVAMDTENLPEVLVGSEPWHNALPAEWVPVITRDNQRQRRQNSQKPFSDAYLAGMPPKRRKLIAAAKPQGESLSQTISEGVRHAIQAVGVSSPLAEQAIAEAGRDPTLQQAYKEQEKAAVRPNLIDDPDFKPSCFPNANKFFNK